MTALLVAVGVIVGLLLMGVLAFLVGSVLALDRQHEALVGHLAHHDVALAKLEGRVAQLERRR